MAIADAGTAVRYARSRVGLLRPLGLFAACFLIAAATPVGGAYAETLNAAITSAFAGNPDLNAERARQRATAQAVPQAIAGFTPRATLNAQVGRQRDELHPPGFARTRTPRGVSLTLSQPLFQGFRAINGLRAARAEVKSGENQLDNRGQSIILDAITVYLDVLRDRELVAFQRQHVKLLESQLRATRERQRAGDLTRTDVSQAEMRLSLARAELSQAEANLAASNAMFEEVIGHMPGNLAAATGAERWLPRAMDEALRIALAENPAIRAAANAEAAADHEIDRTRGELLPTVSLEVSVGREFDTGFTTDREDQASVMVRATVPLYQGGAVVSRIKEARETRSQRKFDRGRIHNEVRSTIQIAWRQHEAARARTSASQAQVGAAEDALRGVRAESQAGLRTVLDILDAERELLLAKVSNAQARRDETVTGYQVLAAMGRLTPDRLGLRVAAAE